jgi:hypothetical protein
MDGFAQNRPQFVIFFFKKNNLFFVIFLFCPVVNKLLRVFYREIHRKIHRRIKLLRFSCTISPSSLICTTQQLQPRLNTPPFHKSTKKYTNPKRPRAGFGRIWPETPTASPDRLETHALISLSEMRKIILVIWATHSTL